MEFESWKKSFILQLYESTKDAVEVAKRNYLESRLGNAIRREMTEVNEKYQSLFYQNESKFREIWEKFQALEEQTNSAIAKLKDNSDAFCAASSHGIPYKVEMLKFDEIEKIKLPDYSTFLFDPNFISFGPLSEKWEEIKDCLQQEFAIYLENSPVLTLGRSCSASLSSSMNISGALLEHGEDEFEMMEDKEIASTSSSASRPVPDSDISLRRGVSGGGGPLPGHGSGNSKPTVVSRSRKKLSFKRTMSETLQQIVFSAAHSAENKRVVTRSAMNS